MSTPRRMVILTDGFHDPHMAKTAICLLQYCADEVVAVLDAPSVGKTCQEVFGVGGAIPCVGALADAAEANTLLIGIAPPGGKLPATWRATILEALARRMTVVSGLHDFLRDDAEFRRAAEQYGAAMVDVRDNQERDVARRIGIREGCLRLHTVGNDCCCGKMVTSLELARGLGCAGVDAAFVATGQTGILISGDGIAIDRVIADFVAGAAEKLVLAHQHHEVIVVEGQGSLFHPRYSCVSLGLLHGLIPDGLVLCYEMGSHTVFGMEQVRLPSLERTREFYESAANLMHPCRVLGVAVNGRRFSDEAVAEECERVSHRLGLPACDVVRQGPKLLVEAAMQLRRQLKKTPDAADRPAL
ncbi:MAG: DUF1611 domain-containing protein [Planctomycetaceae bacterium]|nr:DUF1611 domain-containing protein [Planctomycetaceae bacterium]